MAGLGSIKPTILPVPVQPRPIEKVEINKPEQDLGGKKVQKEENDLNKKTKVEE